MALGVGSAVKQKSVQDNIERPRANLAGSQTADTDVSRQSVVELTQARTQKQQEKLENKTRLRRREAGLQSNKSRSRSRHDRRTRLTEELDAGKRYMKTGSLAALEEADAHGDSSAMQPFERIGPDSTSMDGPVTHSRAMRGEIPIRGSDPRQPYYMPTPENSGGSDLKDNDGLKLTLEANLEVEIELKASIRGDITLSLFA